MPYNFDQFEVSEETEIKITEGSLTIEEYEWLRSNGVFQIDGHQTNTGVATTAKLDVEKLSRIAFEYDLLKQAASSVETDILGTFRQSDDRTLTTSEIARRTDRPKSSVSRALGRLTEKKKLSKVQAGVYRRL